MDRFVQIKYYHDSGVFQLNTKTPKAEILCGVDFGSYPFDKHSCEFSMKSSMNLSHQEVLTVTTLKHKDSVKFHSLLQVFETTLNYNPDSFVSARYDIDYSPLEKDVITMFTNNGNETYALTGFRINFARYRSPFLMNVFLPTGVLTFISFISFLIPVDNVSGRMALMVTIFLMLVNISAQQHALQQAVN